VSASDVVPIPQSVDEVTPEWLTAALREAGVLTGGRVVEATSARVGREYGFTGVVRRIRVRYEDATRDKPADGAGRGCLGFAQERDPARMCRHYERCAREERFYREIGASFVPRVCYSAADEISGRSCSC
jgi:hypothetical protein